MAGTAALSTVLKSTLGSLSDPAIKEMNLLCSVQKEQEKLGQTLSSIETTLNAVENGEFIITEPVKHWLGQLKDVLYDADDVIDDFRTEALIQKMDKSWIEKVFSFLSCCSNSLAYFWKMGHRIKDIRERLDNIEKNRTQFEPRAPHNLAKLVDNFHQQRETDSSLPSGVTGRDGDKEEIVNLLMNCGSEDADGNISIIPIVGPGGIGKTTLAKMVFSDDRIKGHFDLCIWVCVSTDFDKKKIIEKIVESVTGEKCAGLQMETLRNHLGDKLGGKRYLLVLDDVWNEDHGKWVELKDLLMMNSGKKAGSKIIVTTRSKDVAKVVCPTLKSYDLSFLPVNESWYVFKWRALIPGQETPALEKIGKEIVGKCGGLPLALSALGSLLHGNVNEDDWKYVQDNEMWRDLTGKELDVLPILKFSYDNLPSSQLKQCFAYCSLFPKDYEFSKEMLIRIWMAQGFLQSSDPTKRRMEDIGNHYFNILLSRSFFQDVEEDVYGNVRSFKMHDIMHDLAQSVSGGECLIVDETDTSIPACVQHLISTSDTYQGFSASHKLRTFIGEGVEAYAWSSFKYLRVLQLFSVSQKFSCHISELKHLRFLLVFGESIKKFPESIIMLQNLQTLFLMGCDLKKLPKDIGKIESLRHIYIVDNDKIKTLPNSICKLTNLQSLTLGGCTGIEELPINIGEMISLRELKVRGLEKIKRLPKSISKLTNLETLVLDDCDELEALPEDIGNMVSLRQLVLDWHNESICLPSGVGQLTRLQSLSYFNVGKDGYRSHPKLSELHGLNNLRGGLSITNLENATTSEAKEAKLRDKQYLKALSLEWNTGSGGDDNDDVAFLEALEPYGNLQELEIDGYGGISFPPWMMKMTVVPFPHLSRVVLADCRQCQYFPSLGQLPSLVSLFVYHLEDLEYIKNYTLCGGSTKFFPSLKVLCLEQMWKLKAWSRIEETEDEDAGATKATTLAAKTVAQEEQRRQMLLSFPCLSILTIKDCPNLETMPFHPCVEKVTLQNFSGNLLQSMMTVAAPVNPPPTTTSLSSLSIFEKLKYLDIRGCNDEESLPKEGLRGSSSIWTLSIEGCHAKISLFPESMSLPKGLQHATRLQHLDISFCEGLTSLPEWLRNFAYLEKLFIKKCPNIRSLPQGMQRLIELKELCIRACPHLSRRCERRVGEDWPKIAHILDVEVYAD